MSGPPFHSIVLDDSDYTSSSVAGTEFDCLERALEQTSHVQPVQATHRTASPRSDPSSVFPQDIFTPGDFPADSPHQSSTITAWPNSSASLPQFVFPEVPNPLDASACYSSQRSHSGHSESLGIGSLFSQRELRAVTMPTVRHFHGGLNGAYDGLSYDLNNHTASYSPRGISSSSIVTSMAMGPMPGVGVPNKPAFRLGPTLPLYSVRPTSTFKSPRLSNPVAHSITPGDGFGTDPYLFLSPSSGPISLHTETSQNQVYPQPKVTTRSDQLYTIIVPSKDVVFPSSKSTEKDPFFRCCWKDCSAWIMSDGRAITHHMTRAHSVQKNDEGSYTCEWAGCSKTREWSGLVRHIQKHIRLQWQCSVCGALRARRDCVRRHAKESGCKDAHPNRYPGKLAYTAKENGNDTVTMTKMPQSK